MRKVKVFSLESVQQEAMEIWRELEDAGFETYLVGGAVRDQLIGLDAKDFDLATAATPDQIAEVIQVQLPTAKMDFVGASFGVMIVNGIEIATFRGDNYDSEGNFIGVTYVNSIEEDLSRRDLTVNAMAVTSSGMIIDPFNGLDDVEEKLIRFVGDPDDRINQDTDGYVRIIRACRFIAKLGFAPTGSTADAIWRNRDKTNEIAPERIRIELLKAMEVKTPSIFFSAMQYLGCLELIFPDLSDCYLHTGGKHHPETVWEHNMLVGDSLPASDPILRLAGYLHDIGKPIAWAECNGRFINHHKIGKKILEQTLPELKFSNSEVKRICGLVNFHMFFISGLSAKAQRKLLKNLDAYSIDWHDLVRIRIADHKGNVAKPKMTPSEIKLIVKSFTQVEDIPRDTKSLAVTGGQLIKEFGLVPGPIVGKIQNALLEFVLETGEESEDCLLVKSHELLKKEA
jgi:tRNA nucleotidyltransferase/poly(A) polymerase